jgi:hypothetical protein
MKSLRFQRFLINLITASITRMEVGGAEFTYGGCAFGTPVPGSCFGEIGRPTSARGESR